MLIARTWQLVLLALLLAGCPRPGAGRCDDGVRNGQESDVDCGGTCGPCALEKACIVNEDCESTRCVGKKCSGASCRDGKKSGDESDVDCGGSCAECAPGQHCTSPADCAENVCTAGTCATPTCADQQQNGLESDVDCGGPGCVPCPMDGGCFRNADCMTGACLDGHCSVSCRAPLLVCPPQCVDPRSDPANCGMCGHACGPMEACINSQCVTPCGNGTSRCGANACKDLMGDVLNCGMCNRVCGPHEGCFGGNCMIACGPGQIPCAGECIRPGTDMQHCGMCNHPCGQGEVCSQGQCMPSCTAPTVSCNSGTSCADLNVDPDHCGSCTNSCPATPNADRLCLSMSCGRSICHFGFADCNFMMNDGCEEDLMTNDIHCGACGRACMGGLHCDGGNCE